MLFRKKVENKVNKIAMDRQYRQDIWSAQDFYKGLKKGKTCIGSLLFTGDEREGRIVKQLCRYLDYKYLGHKDHLCNLMDCSNKVMVTHYYVE